VSSAQKGEKVIWLNISGQAHQCTGLLASFENALRGLLPRRRRMTKCGSFTAMPTGINPDLHDLGLPHVSTHLFTRTEHRETPEERCFQIGGNLIHQF
jgi:hypothetical protein